MNWQKQRSRQAASVLFALIFLASGFLLPATDVYAARWSGHVRDLTLGETVSGTVKEEDYLGKVEGISNTYEKGYQHIYKFVMPQNGFLDISVASRNKDYFYGCHKNRLNGFAIYSAAASDKLIWRSDGCKNTVYPNYDSPWYFGSAKVRLQKGSYYFVLTRRLPCDTPYRLTLRCRESEADASPVSRPSFRMTEDGTDKSGAFTPVGKQVSFSVTSHADPGGVRTPSVTVWDRSGSTLKPGRDYLVSCRGGLKYAGTYTVTIIFTGNYRGIPDKTFTIIPPERLTCG